MIRLLIYIYIGIIVVDALLSYFPQYRNHPWALLVKQAADVTLKPVRKLLPPDMPVDLSPVIVILALNILMALW